MSPAKKNLKPRYQIIADELRSEITSETFAQHDMLPTEMALCARFDVSRHTVRAALHRLREQGFVSMRRGSGTRVISTAPPEPYIRSVNSISELLSYPDTAFEPSDTSHVILTPEDAERLSLQADTEWFRITGIRRSTTSRQAICWQEIFVLPEYESTARRLLTEHIPVHRIIERTHNNRIAQAQLELAACRVSKEVADKLDVAPGSAAMSILRRYASPNDKVFETTLSVHPEDRFVYSLGITYDEAVD
jgi:GntR family transcriptional regulator